MMNAIRGPARRPVAFKRSKRRKQGQQNQQRGSSVLASGSYSTSSFSYPCQDFPSQKSWIPTHPCSTRLMKPENPRETQIEVLPEPRPSLVPGASQASRVLPRCPKILDPPTDEPS
ncbi:Uncharacterized protein Rs2_35634 [Raphanus sativus]|nr:Uncharacterized protein Rs2_35634 [Raphanus sativus]